MMFLNLSLTQFLALFAAVAAFSVALYLLDRTRRKKVVATLRFWVMPGQPAPVTRRRKIQQPLSLLLQLLGMALLLLAIAEFQLGGRQSLRRDHVIVLDTSAWMAAQAPNRPGTTQSPNQGTTLMDLARANAIAWLRAVPSADRVMLIRADGLATPATAWERDHRNIIKAILESQPGATALNLSQSLVFAGEMQRAAGAAREGGPSTAGEVVYVGPGRLTAREADNLNLPRLNALRVIPVNDDVENIGLRSVGARPAAGKDVWQVLARVHNYGSVQQAATVTLAFGGAPEGTRTLVIAPGGEQEASFEVNTRAAGVLETRLYPKDAFLADNYAALEIPQMRTVHAIVYSDQPDRLRPALSSDPRVTTEFHPTADYRPEMRLPAADSKSAMRLPAALLILDHFRPTALPAGNVLWIDPPPGPGIRETADHPKEIAWTPDHPVTAGLRVRDLQIDQASVFDPAPGDIRLATIDKGPIALASVSADGKSHVVTLGFDPFAPALRYELSTPLLLANILRWMEPGVFRDIDVGTQSAGTVASPVSAEQADAGQRSTLQVLSETGTNLPFNVRDRQVEFFSGDASRVRVIAGNTERVYSLTLPEMWDVKWTPPATVRHGIPTLNDSLRRSPDLWPFLAALGAALLLLEWFAYGRHTAAGVQLSRPKLEKAA
jgi:hypothetical protein